jgi:serine protease Do
MQVTVQAVLAEKPSEATLASTTFGGKATEGPKTTELADLGIKIAPVSNDLRDKFQLDGDQKGVVITDVAPGSAAADRGLKAGDVIVEVQQAEVSSPADVQKRVEAARKADRKFVLMLIQRQDGKQYLPLSLSKEKGKQPG